MRMVKEDATDEEIIDALKLSCAWDFVEKLPDTINSNVGERGRGLSEGQAQRIAIARALYNDPSIILADEPTASLDSEKAFEVVKILAKEAKDKNKAIMMVTHDTRLIDFCDKVYEIKDGTMNLYDKETAVAH